MIRWVLEALYHLIRIDWLMSSRAGFGAVRDIVGTAPSSLFNGHTGPDSQRLCRAIDIACVLYFKNVLCLQRSSATTLLLRRNGFPAELVIGARTVPFKSHAWVELNRTVINDKAYISQLYRELDRC